MAGRPAGVRVSAPVAWALLAKQIQPGDVVSEMAIFSGKVRVTMASGDVFEFELTKNKLTGVSWYEVFVGASTSSSATASWSRRSDDRTRADHLARLRNGKIEPATDAEIEFLRSLVR